VADGANDAVFAKRRIICADYLGQLAEMMH
jgi:hypothetical protein